MDMDIEKTMRFMLDMQAKHEAWLQQHDGEISRLNASMAAASDLIGRLAQAETRLVERMDTGFQKLRADVEKLTAGVDGLREAQAATEYKLNALIDTVDKLARRNGHDRPGAA